MPQDSGWQYCSHPDTTITRPSSSCAFSTTSCTVNGRSSGPPAQAANMRNKAGEKRIVRPNVRLFPAKQVRPSPASRLSSEARSPHRDVPAQLPRLRGPFWIRRKWTPPPITPSASSVRTH